MVNSVSYSKYPTDGQPTYNGGNFMSNTQVSTVGCSGTSCKTLAANSVFAEPVDKGTTLAPVNGLIGGRRRRTRKGGKSKKGSKSKKGVRKSGKSRKGVRKGVKKGGKSKKGVRKGTKGKSRKGGKRKMRGGSKNTQLMGNICHSAGYSIGATNTELSPKEVGLAAGHFEPYTKTN